MRANGFIIKPVHAALLLSSVLLLILSVLVPKDLYRAAVLHRTLNDHPLSRSDTSSSTLASSLSSMILPSLALEEEDVEQEGSLRWPEAHFKSVAKLKGSLDEHEKERKVPGAECGHNYQVLVEGEEDDSKKSPICSLEELKEKATMGSRLSNDSPYAFPGCRLHWFDAEEACGLFETFDIVLATAGDSLVRHMTQALMTIMIDDYQKGGMRWWDQDERLRETCQCDLQLCDEPVKCRFNTMANYGTPFPEFEKEDQREKICPQWSRNRVFFLPEAGPVLGIENTGSGPLRDIIRDHNTTRLFVYLSFGLHLQFDWGAGKTGYLDSLWAMLGESKDDGRLGYPPHAFLVTAPYPGPLKDTAAFPRQARPHVLAWNEHLREFQAHYTDRSTLIDYAPLSDNSTSPDGTHFTQSTNVILAQMVLNYMAAMSYDAPTTPTHDIG